MFLVKRFYDWAQNKFKYAYSNKLWVTNKVSRPHCYLKTKKKETLTPVKSMDSLQRFDLLTSHIQN